MQQSVVFLRRAVTVTVTTGESHFSMSFAWQRRIANNNGDGQLRPSSNSTSKSLHLWWCASNKKNSCRLRLEQCGRWATCILIRPQPGALSDDGDFGKSTHGTVCLARRYLLGAIEKGCRKVKTTPQKKTIRQAALGGTHSARIAISRPFHHLVKKDHLRQKQVSIS